MFPTSADQTRPIYASGFDRTNDRLWEQIRQRYGPLLFLILYKLSGDKIKARDILFDAFKVCKLKKVGSRAPIPLCQQILRYGFRMVIQYLRIHRRETKLVQPFENNFNMLNLVFFELASCKLVSWQLGLSELEVRLGLKKEMRLLNDLNKHRSIRFPKMI